MNAAEREWMPHGRFTIRKYRDRPDGTPDFEAGPYETLEFLNEFVDAGSAILLDLLIGAGGTVFSNANAHIGIGDSATAVSAGQTDLQAATNKLRKGMQVSYPARVGQVLTFKSQFGSGEANYAWNEIGLFNAASAGAMLCRKTGTYGTKSGGTWTIEYQLSLP